MKVVTFNSSELAAILTLRRMLDMIVDNAGRVFCEWIFERDDKAMPVNGENQVKAGAQCWRKQLQCGAEVGLRDISELCYPIAKRELFVDVYLPIVEFEEVLQGVKMELSVKQMDVKTIEWLAEVVAQRYGVFLKADVHESGDVLGIFLDERGVFNADDSKTLAEELGLLGEVGEDLAF